MLAREVGTAPLRPLLLVGLRAGALVILSMLAIVLFGAIGTAIHTYPQAVAASPSRYESEFYSSAPLTEDLGDITSVSAGSTFVNTWQVSPLVGSLTVDATFYGDITINDTRATGDPNRHMIYVAAERRCDVVFETDPPTYLKGCR